MLIEYPPGLRDTIKSFGVDIGNHALINPTEGLQELHGAVASEMGCDDPFGFEQFGFSLNPIKAVQKKVIKPIVIKNAKTPGQKAVAKVIATAPLKVNVKASAVGLGKMAATGASIASFVVPGAGPIVGSAGLAALGAADKVLSDPKVKNAAAVIKNTQALAALGQPGAQRGAAVLSAVAQLRKKQATQPGQPVIHIKTTAQQAAVAAMIPKTVAKVSPEDVQKIVQQALADAKKKGWVERLLGWFGLERKPSIAIQVRT